MGTQGMTTLNPLDMLGYDLQPCCSHMYKINHSIPGVAMSYALFPYVIQVTCHSSIWQKRHSDLSESQASEKVIWALQSIFFFISSH